MPDQPPTFGRILVRVAITDVHTASPLPAFQQVYDPEATLKAVLHNALRHYTPALWGRDDAVLMLISRERPLATLAITKDGWYVDEPETFYRTTAGPQAAFPVTLGDYLNLHADDQTTLGTVQFELRCVAIPENLPIMTR